MGDLRRMTPVWLRTIVGLSLAIVGFWLCLTSARTQAAATRDRDARTNVFAAQIEEEHRKNGFLGGATLVCIGSGILLMSERSPAERNRYTTLSWIRVAAFADAACVKR